MAKTWEKRALDNLTDVSAVFKKNNIQFWLDYGTLLGAIRNKMLVQSMQDIDLGMMDDNWETLNSLQKEFKLMRFKMFFKQFILNNVSYNTVKLLRDDVFVDISLYKQYNKYAIDVHGKWGMPLKMARLPFYIFPIRRDIANKSRLISSHFDVLPSKKVMPPSYLARWIMGWTSYYFNAVPMVFFEKTDKIILYNDEYDIPSNTASYISYTYGDDWRMPNKNYKNYKDSQGFKLFLTKNKIEVNNL